MERTYEQHRLQISHLSSAHGKFLEIPGPQSTTEPKQVPPKAETPKQTLLLQQYVPPSTSGRARQCTP